MILVTGGRKFGPGNHVCVVLDALSAQYPNMCVVQGGASGADSHARRWARARGKPCITMDAQWDRLGPKAGSLRNQWILDCISINFCVAFPGGAGTADMKRRCEEKGIKVYEA